jgi:hypothetical protein
MNSHSPSDKEPRIPIGTLGEFEMYGLLLPKNLIYRGAGNPSDVITIPASMAVRMTLNILNIWDISAAVWGSVLGVIPERVEDYKKGSFPTETAHLQRLEDILAIYRALKVLIPDDSLANSWCSTPNGFFDQRRPIDVIVAQGTQVVRRFLEGWMG